MNKATDRAQFDQCDFILRLPNLDTLLAHLELYGEKAALFKVDIARAFRNVRIDPGDALHLGIKWKGEYYLDRNLAFGLCTAIFQRITDFIDLLMAKRGFSIYNYIDDMYACCQEDQAQEALQTLLSIVANIGLPLNQKKVFAPTKKLAVMGIVVDIEERTFSIPEDKLCA